MDLHGIGPSNRFLIPQRDHRWPHVLSLLLMVSALVVLALGLVGWPRLKSTSIHYELMVADLEQRQRSLMIELELERSPENLAARARALGMVPAAPAGLPAQADSKVSR